MSELPPYSVRVSARAKLRWLRWSAALRSEASPLRSENLTALDGENASSYLEARVGREFRDTVLRPWLGARLACELEELSAAGSTVGNDGLGHGRAPDRPGRSC